MKKSKLLTILVILPTLALAACARAPVIQGSASTAQNSPITNAAAQVQSSNRTSSSVLTNVANLAQTNATAPTDLSSFQSVFESIFQSVSPSVVLINVTEPAAATTAPSTGRSGRTSPFGTNPQNPQLPQTPQTPQAAQALGSGFIWDTQGHIVTNNHVVAGATSITVTFSDGTTVNAKVVGTDPNADLAVIQVSAPANLLVPLTLADTSQVKVGEIAIAIGNPFGLQNTMTQGIISGLQRSLPTNLDSATAQTGPTYNIPDIIQTDAPINPGNSGGVLVDTTGQVIGVTAAMESNSGSSSGIGFVIPAEIVQKVVPALISKGSYQQSYLGMAGTDMTPDLAKAMGLDSSTRGVLVETVTSGGPAAAGGLLASTQLATINGQSATVGGDVITAIDGQPVNTFADLGTYLFLHTTPGQTVTLTVLRQGKSTSVKVTTGVLPIQ